MNILTLDVETTIRNEGSPFDERNKLCAVALRSNQGCIVYPIEYDGAPYGDSLEHVKVAVGKSDLVVGFNIKFDLHWLRRYGITLPVNCFIWDCQLCQFILNGQNEPFPSLDSTGLYYSLGGKLSGGLSQYWDVGIDTPAISWIEIEEYARRDVELTYQIFLKQQDLLASNPILKTLVNLSCQDLLVLADIEWNGL